MKIILLYCNSFGYTPKEKTLDFVPDAAGTKKHNDVQVLFIHLEKEADPEFSMGFLNRLDERMNNSEVESCQTPFGYFLDLQVDAPGFSLARVFKQF